MKVISGIAIPFSFVSCVAASSTSASLAKIESLVATHDTAGLKQYLTELRESPTGTYINDDFVSVINGVIKSVNEDVIDVTQAEHDADEKQVDEWTRDLETYSSRAFAEGFDAAMNADTNYINCMDQELIYVKDYETSRDIRDANHADMTTKCDIVASWPLIEENVPVSPYSCVIGENCDAVNKAWADDLNVHKTSTTGIVKQNQADYAVAVTNCNDATKVYNAQAADTSAKLEAYSTQHQTCESLLTTRRVVFCRWGYDLNMYCKLSDDYVDGVNAVLAREEQRNVLWSQSHKTVCLLTDWVEGKDLEVDNTCQFDPLYPIYYDDVYMHEDPLCSAADQMFTGEEYDVPMDPNSTKYHKLFDYSWAMNHDRGTSPFAFCSDDQPVMMVEATTTYASIGSYMSTWFRRGAHPFHETSVWTILDAPMEMMESIMIQAHRQDRLSGVKTTVSIPGAGIMYTYCVSDECAGLDNLPASGWTAMDDMITIQYCRRANYCPETEKMRIFKKPVLADEKIVFSFTGTFTGGWTVQLTEY